MKNPFDTIKNAFKKHQKSATMPHGIDPHAHWAMLLRMFFGIVLCLILFNFYLLYKIKNEKIFQVTAPQEEGTNLLRENLLKSVTESFNQKAAKEGEIKSNLPSYSDPSR